MAFDPIRARSSIEALQALCGTRPEAPVNITALMEEIANAEEEVAQLTRALREATEPPTFMGEPVVLQKLARPVDETDFYGIEDAIAQALRDCEGEDPDTCSLSPKTMRRLRMALTAAQTDREFQQREAYAEGRKDERETLQERGILVDCGWCNGSGEREIVAGNGNGGPDDSLEFAPCPECGGTGDAAGGARHRDSNSLTLPWRLYSDVAEMFKNCEWEGMTPADLVNFLTATQNPDGKTWLERIHSDGVNRLAFRDAARENIARVGQ